MIKFGEVAVEICMNSAGVRISDIEDIRPAATDFCEFVRKRANLRIAASHNIASRVPMVDADGEPLATSVFGWGGDENQWWEDSRFALGNPLSEACRTSASPFWANRHGARDETGKRVLQHLDFSYYGHTTSNRASIVFPVHLPFSQIGIVTLSCAGSERDELGQVFAENFADFYLMSHLFIGDYARLRSEQRWLPRLCKLTKYEIGCLRWVARGKTDEEIAIILNRSRPTIRFHLQNAAAKLNAMNRSQAVFKAGQLGYLTFGSSNH